MAYMACTVPEPDRPLPPLRVLIAAPRGFCAGVDRAIQIVELALERFERVEHARALSVHEGPTFAFLTKTTWSADDTAQVVEALKSRSPAIGAPRSEDICYATSNRQAAVKAIAAECDRLLVIGAPNSSNSMRLAEVAERMGVPARLIERAGAIDWGWLGQPATPGLTAGAPAPGVLVREVVDALRSRFDVTEEVADHSPERMTFKLPRELLPDRAA